MKLLHTIFTIALFISLSLLANNDDKNPSNFANERLDALLKTFNTGDKAKYEEFRKYYKTPEEHPVDQELVFFQMTGGFDIKKIEKSTPYRVEALLQEKNSETIGRIILEVEDVPEHLITKMDVMAIERPSEFKIPRVTETQAIDALRNKIDQLYGEGKFSGAVLIAKNGKIIFTDVKGFADSDKKIPNRLDTRFNMGSMNKMFTAIAIAQLAQEGKLSFSDSLMKYLPDYPNPEFAKVTIH
jgi:hypothetical protein